MILNLTFNAAVFFYLLCDYGNSLVLHCEHQDIYPGNQGEVAFWKNGNRQFSRCDGAPCFENLCLLGLTLV